jgi:hypothetical protein
LSYAPGLCFQLITDDATSLKSSIVS